MIRNIISQDFNAIKFSFHITFIHIIETHKVISKSFASSNYLFNYYCEVSVFTRDFFQMIFNFDNHL